MYDSKKATFTFLKAKPVYYNYRMQGMGFHNKFSNGFIIKHKFFILLMSTNVVYVGLLENMIQASMSDIRLLKNFSSVWEIGTQFRLKYLCPFDTKNSQKSFVLTNRSVFPPLTNAVSIVIIYGLRRSGQRALHTTSVNRNLEFFTLFPGSNPQYCLFLSFSLYFRLTH